MNSEKNCSGCTGGSKNDIFNTPVVGGFSVLTGESKTDIFPDNSFTIDALQTY